VPYSSLHWCFPPWHTGWGRWGWCLNHLQPNKQVQCSRIEHAVHGEKRETLHPCHEWSTSWAHQAPLPNLVWLDQSGQLSRLGFSSHRKLNRLPLSVINARPVHLQHRMESNAPLSSKQCHCQTRHSTSCRLCQTQTVAKKHAKSSQYLLAILSKQSESPNHFCVHEVPVMLIDIQDQT
jgi:hypothetical protein